VIQNYILKSYSSVGTVTTGECLNKAVQTSSTALVLRQKIKFFNIKYYIHTFYKEKRLPLNAWNIAKMKNFDTRDCKPFCILLKCRLYFSQISRNSCPKEGNSSKVLAYCIIW
jgi:hypothetical protein